MHTQENPLSPTPHDAKRPSIAKARVWAIAFWIALALVWLVVLRFDLRQHNSNPWLYVAVAGALLICAANILVQVLSSRRK